MATDDPLRQGAWQPASLARAWWQRARDAVRLGERELVALVVLGLLLLAGATIAYVRARPVEASTLLPAASAQPSVEPSNGAAIFVHVVGAVRKPGVYEFGLGARVLDAVRAAGGLTPKAEQAGINLARQLSDGEQILVPQKGSSGPAAGGSAAPASAGGRVNINSASAGDLDDLPGIGPVLAERIVQYRDQHGPFRSVKDLTKVSGIGPRKFESIEPLVTV